MKVIGIVNQKGGVGKTATAVALADGLARRNFRTLALDVDPQGQITASFGISDIDTALPPAAKLLAKQPHLEVRKVADNLDIVPSAIGLERCNIELAGKVGRENYLKKSLTLILEGGYDFVVMDTNPSLSVITLNAIAACDKIIVPFKPEFQSLNGVDILLDTLAELSICGCNADVMGFLATMADMRRVSTRQVIDYLKGYARENNSRVFNAIIRSSVTVANAPGLGKTVYSYRPTSAVAQDYDRFVDEVLESV